MKKQYGETEKRGATATKTEIPGLQFLHSFGESLCRGNQVTRPNKPGCNRPSPVSSLCLLIAFSEEEDEEERVVSLPYRTPGLYELVHPPCSNKVRKLYRNCQSC
ncbi:hypothetical protein ElyMa_005776000 [Elysia marginata]|uniref:Uncharacterized protein n=1 Tax=Elysia marginata TaxID=1093978 RepID=A0AAV4FQY1_9GAST|nr:hypothetical protein ElyMa_005776000 [Elysia marginata]